MIINEMHSTDHRFGRYEPGKIIINEQTYEHSIWFDQRAIHPFPPLSTDGIQDTDFEDIIPKNPDIVIIGTGSQHRHLRSDQTALLTHNGVGVEIMSTQAAIRSFMILSQDSRHVIACLLL